MDWFYLALLSSAIWGAVVLIDDNLLRSVYKSPEFGTISSGLLALLPLISLFFVDITIPSLKVMMLALLSGFLLVTAYFFYFKSLLIEAPSLVITLWGLSPAFVPFLAFFFVGELLTLSQYIGFVVILGAGLGISSVDIKRLKFSKVLFIMIFASLITAIVSVLFKFIYQNVDFWSGFIFVSLGMGLAGFFYIFTLKKGRTFFPDLYKRKRFLGLFVLVELLNIAAVLVFSLAISLGSVSLVEVIGGTEAIFVLVFALLLYPFFPRFFREATHTGKMRKIFFMVIMLIGLLIINL